MTKLNEKIDLLEELGFIPFGLNIPIDMEIVDVRATRYDYFGYKFAENEAYDNRALSIQIKHSKVDNPFWITVFEGATYRETNTRCIIATLEPTINSNFELDMADDTIYSTDSVTIDKTIDSIETIKNLLFAFKCRLILDGDDSKLYTEGKSPTFLDNSNALVEVVDSLTSLEFVEFYEKISKSNPDIKKVQEVKDKLFKVASGNLYSVTVVIDNQIEKIVMFLQQDETEKMFIKYCKKYYNNDGITQYAEENNITGELTLQQWEGYFHSEAWYDVNDLANVQINAM